MASGKQKVTMVEASGSPGTAVAAPAGTAVALPAELASELAQYAKDDAAKERPQISKISLKSGMMSYMGAQVPNDKMDVVILAVAFRNTWYPNRYDPDNVVNPSCFAISLTGEDMSPHENVKEPVHETCEGCPNAEWGTAMRDGVPSRGKACKEGRRMLVIPAGAIDSAEAVKKAEMAVVDIPVTSVKSYGTFVNTMGALGRPMWTAITTLSVVRDLKTQFKLNFDPKSFINDVGVIRAIQARLEDAQRIVTLPYDETELVPKEEAPVNTKISKKR
jgi:hypothetical protein